MASRFPAHTIVSEDQSSASSLSGEDEAESDNSEDSFSVPCIFFHLGGTAIEPTLIKIIMSSQEADGDDDDDVEAQKGTTSREEKKKKQRLLPVLIIPVSTESVRCGSKNHRRRCRN